MWSRRLGLRGWILIGVGGVVAVVLVTFFVVIGALLECDYRTAPMHWPAVKFTPEGWNSTVDHERYIYVHDLIKSRTLNGKTRADVRTLIGEGMPRRDARSSYLLYWINSPGCPGAPSSYLLYVRFGDSDRVMEVSIEEGG